MIKKNKKKEKKQIDFTQTKQMAFKFMYIGKNYDGLVIQANTKNTIEEQIFTALKRCNYLDSNKSTEDLISNSNFSICGRTDKGVNSTGNVFSLSLRYNINYNYIKTLNNLLPNDIYILSNTIVDDSFDARFSCLYREYKYFFLKKNLNINLMKKACKLLEGVHNFKKFCKIDKSDESYESKNYERRIFEIDIFECENDFLFPFKIEGNFINNDYYKPYFCLIKGSAFLWHQVRCIMGILFLIGNELEDIDLINQMLNPNTDYNFLYPIADDSNLVLTDCIFEFVNLNSNESNEISSDLFFKLEKVYQDNLIQSVVNTHFFNVMFNTNLNFFQMLNDEKKGKKDIFNLINNNFRRKQKYTKMLQHKINRDKHKKNN